MKLWLSEFKNEFKAYSTFTSKEEMEHHIKCFCAEKNIKKCFFRVEGVAEIKVIREVEGLGALFG